MKTKLLAVAVVGILVLSLVLGASMALPQGMSPLDFQKTKTQPKPQPQNEPEKPKMSALTFHDTWRKLWEDHIWWTRMVIIGILDDLGGAGNYTDRLLQNVPDMVNTLKPFYGDNATQFGGLLKDHLLIAAQILVEAKAGHNITTLVNTWYNNANDLATLMNRLNPKFWGLDEAKSMWKMHLDATLEEAVAHLKKDWAADIVAFDKVHVLALKMADFFSNGTIRQFPQDFTMLGHIAQP